MTETLLRILHITLVMALGAGMGACTFSEEPEPCPYNIKLEYWYAGSGLENVLPLYVDNLRQYIFDGEGKLINEVSAEGKEVKQWSGTLPDGTYTIVAWGNLDDSQQVLTQSGERNLQDMLLSARVNGVPPDYRGNTARLYYGTAQLVIDGGITLRKRIYMAHAHAALSITVRWMSNPPTRDGAYRMRLRGTPSVYEFKSGFEGIVPSGDGSYSLPVMQSPITYHETRAAMNYEEEVTGQFVTFRYTSQTHPMWSLWKDGRQIVKELDLFLFFDKLPMDMGTNIEQEFDLLVTIYEDKIVVTQMGSTDWDEGGTIG